MSLAWLAVALLPWFAAFAWPLVALFLRMPAASESIAGWWDPLLLSKVASTAWQSAWSAGISGVLGLLVGLALRKYPRTHAWLRIPFGIPALVAVSAWTSLLRGTGWAYSLEAVILAHVVFNVPWVALAVAQSASSIPKAWDEAARSLGADRWSRLASVWWPVMGPVWLASISQVFILCSMSFVIVLVLGGGPPVETLETAIYAAVRMGTLDLPLAARLAGWQLVLSLLPWLVVRAFFRPVKLLSQKPIGSSERAPLWAWTLAAGWLLPYFGFFKDWNPSRMGELWDWGALRTPIFFSMGISVATAWFAVGWAVLSLIALGRRAGPSWIEGLLLLPSGVGTLTLSMGFWLAYSRWVDPFAGSVVALVVIQGVVFFPFALRALLPVAQAHPRSLWELARSQGASRVQAFWMVEWPRWRQPVWSTLAMIASASLGEVAAVSFFSSEHLVTLPLLASRWMATYRFDQAYGVSALLLLLAVLVAFLPGLSRQPRNFFGA